jgi:alpha-methylacyl-CoA racemase
MERLGLGPEECLARNPRLVYGRMTGWGQSGPLAKVAGHDLNYVALAGVLHGLGQDPARPHFPSNLLGDFGGGSTYLLVGVLAALLEARTSGRGQIVDAAIVDGTAHLSAMHASMLASGAAHERRAEGVLDGGAPYYDLYETADGRHMSVAALEPHFYAELLRLLDLADAPDRDDPEQWPALRDALAARFRERTQAAWAEVFDGTDACVAPVLPPSQAARHPQLSAREVYVDRAGFLEPAPAPRFSRTPATLTRGPSVPGGQTREALVAWGVDADALIASGAATQA